MVVTYDEVAAQASALNPEDRLRLVTELLLFSGNEPKRSVLEFFGVNGPLQENVDERLRRGRDE